MTPMQELCAMRDERDAAIRERDEALAKLARAEHDAHWSAKVMDEANERCAELRASTKSARWNAVYGAIVAKFAPLRVKIGGDRLLDCGLIELAQICLGASRIADQVEEMWEKNRETKA